MRKRALLSVPLVLTASAVWIAPMSQASSGYLLVANIPVGRNPTAIAISPTGASAGDAYVTNYSDGTVSVIDPSGRVIATISTVLAQTVLPFPGPACMRATPTSQIVMTTTSV